MAAKAKDSVSKFIGGDLPYLDFYKTNAVTDYHEEALAMAKELLPAVEKEKGATAKEAAAHFVIATASIASGDMAVAEKSFEVMMTLFAKGFVSTDMKPAAMHMLAEVRIERYATRGQATTQDEAAAAKAAAQALIDSAGSEQTLKVAALHLMASAHIMADDVAEASKVGKDVVAQAVEAGDQIGEAYGKSLTASVLVAGRTGADAAVEAVQSGLEMFRRVADGVGEKLGLLILGNAYTLTVGVDEAFKLVIKDQMAYLKKGKETKGIATCLYKLAKAHFGSANRSAQEDVDNLQMARDAAAKFKELGDAAMETASLVVIASGCLASGTAAEASKAAKIAVDTSKASSEKKNEASAHLLLHKAYLKDSKTDDAIKAAKEAQGLFKELEDKDGEAQALYAAATVYLDTEKSDSALTALREAIPLFRVSGNKAGEAFAMCMCLQALVLKRKRSMAEHREAMKLGCTALLMLRELDEWGGQAKALSGLATLHLGAEDAAASLAVADQLGLVRTVLGDLKEDDYVHFRERGSEFAVQAAMQAGALAKWAGDSKTEGNALYTITNMYISSQNWEQARATAMQAQTKFGAAGDTKGLAMIKKVFESYRDKMAIAKPKPVIRYLPPSSDGRTRGDLMSDTAQTVIWSKPFSEAPYIEYLLEMLSFVNEIIKASSKTQMIIACRGVNGRESAEALPGRLSDISGNTVFACLRTIKLEMPRLHIHTVDLPPHARGHEIAECFGVVKSAPGMQAEVTFKLNRQQL